MPEDLTSFRNVSSEDDINNIYKISDILITDYSSVIFDFAVLDRPIILYMPDLEEYTEQIRGFYFNMDELPGPVAHNEEELFTIIDNLPTILPTYEEKYKLFKKKYAPYEDGQATDRVVKEIFNLSN